MLPKDPMLLLSYINTKLRDEYPSLAAFAEDCNEDEAEIRRILSAAGYEYDEAHNRFS